MTSQAPEIRTIGLVDSLSARRQEILALDRDGEFDLRFVSEVAHLAGPECNLDAIVIADEDGQVETLLKARNSGTNPCPVVAYSSSARPQRIADVVFAGVDDFLGWPFSIAELHAAIERAGHRHACRRSSHPGRSAQTRLGGLTAREREILDLITFEYNSQEIGRELGISAKTVEVHRSNIYRKLSVRNLAGATRIAVLAKLND